MGRLLLRPMMSERMVFMFDYQALQFEVILNLTKNQVFLFVIMRLQQL